MEPVARSATQVEAIISDRSRLISLFDAMVSRFADADLPWLFDAFLLQIAKKFDNLWTVHTSAMTIDQRKMLFEYQERTPRSGWEHALPPMFLVTASTNGSTIPQLNFC
jgi:hypothetical protein